MKNKFGTTLLKQILAAKQFLGFKSSKTPKREKSKKQAYVPGTLGLSNVSRAIKEDYGVIISRKERKLLFMPTAFKAYYNN